MIVALFLAALAAVPVDVVISAGHEGRPASCASFPKRACNLGAAGERAWSPIVADEAARDLRRRGLTVARLPADFHENYVAEAAVFVHFDGSLHPCSSGASIGYDTPAGHAAARTWRMLYGRYFPFAFQPDNFTRGLRDYYAFRQVRAAKGALVLEFGELTCPAQRAWLAPRLRLQGDLLAYFLSRLIGKGQVGLPP
ncbi:MAG: hypothetical protein M3R51_06420 [Candidatus Eremiobacteraeota bacterium]|nr:hypothetical protein [Candidatus Eremiobacteraeota bacterium]